MEGSVSLDQEGRDQIEIFLCCRSLN